MNFRKIYSGAPDKKLSDMTVKIWGFTREGIRKRILILMESTTMIISLAYLKKIGQK